MEHHIAKVWALEFPSQTHKFVALCVARMSIRSGLCWAKQKTIAADTQLHVKTVGRCLRELEEMGWITRNAYVRADGGRGADRIALTLPEVILERTTPDFRSPFGSEDDRDMDSSAPGPRSRLPSRKSKVSTPTAPDSTIEGGLEGESSEDARERDARSEADQVNLPLAVQLIWQAFSQAGRNRSSLADVKTELEKAIRRRPPSETAETRLERVMGGLKAYLATPDARKEHGAFQRGPHRLLLKDRWESFLTDGDGRLEEDQPPVDPEMGTSEKPGPKLQRFWAELAQQGMPWDSSRGPRPGMPGCRISPEIQREFGFTPWSPPPAEDEDGSAFA